MKVMTMKTTLMTLAATLALTTAAFADDMPKMQDAVLGDLTLSAGFAHATLPNQPVAGGFVTIANAGDTDDRLIGAASPIAGVMQIHTMAMSEGVMKMRELPGGLSIPAGENVLLEPGGLHLMFMRLNDPLVMGDTVDVTLTFEQAGDIEVTLPIRNKMAARMTHSSDGDR